MHLIEFLLILTAFAFLLGSLDDLVIDLVFFMSKVRPHRFDSETWKKWRSEPELPIAVMVPAWKEANVLESMVSTNLGRIQYKNYRWFVGVYPNDLPTLEIARKLESRYPDRVTVVVTDKPGPTSKAHCLNCIYAVIEKAAADATHNDLGWIPKFLVIHDAEDVIHPEAFLAVSGYARGFDFVQIPIFSLPVPVKSLIAGTYMDEFAELHLKELPSRHRLGMPIPSAGVGTFFSWQILQTVKSKYGYLFDENNLTEDYEISMRIALIGGKQTFFAALDESSDFIATRGYFPDQFWPSVRQKTRWTTGIVLQTTERWKCYGVGFNPFKILSAHLSLMYALHRDRRAVWSNPATVFGWSYVLFVLGIKEFQSEFAITFKHPKLLQTLFIVNLVLLIYRAISRLAFSARVYGIKHGLVAVLRLMVSNVVNAMATLRALFYYAQGQNRINYRRDGTLKSESSIVWDKTDHRFPTLETIEEASDLSRIKETLPDA